MLRMLEMIQASFKQRIDADDFASAERSRLECREHARMIGAGILANDENRISQIEIVKGYRTLPAADGFAERGAARFVAHVRTIRQIVGAELPHEQLI